MGHRVGWHGVAVCAAVAALIAVLAALPATALADTCSGVTTWGTLSGCFSSGGTVILAGSITADSGDSLTVGDGSAGDSTSVTLDLAGYTLEIESPAAYDAASEVPADASLTINDSVGDGELAVTGSDGGAGIGGDYGVSAGTITINGTPTTVIDAGSTEYGAGIGGGSGGGAGGDVTITGGQVTATGEGGGGGIGGAWGETGYGTGASVSITAGDVTASGGSDGTAVGSSQDTAASFGSLSNAGTLTIPSGASLRVPSAVTVDNSGVLDLDGSLDGDGTIDNTGTILVYSSG